MESKTYKLLKAIAYLILVAGVIIFVAGIAQHTSRGFGMGLLYVLVCAVSSSLFLFFAKVIEQNEERNEQNAKLDKLLTEQLRGIHMILKNIEKSKGA